MLTNRDEVIILVLRNLYKKRIFRLIFSFISSKLRIISLKSLNFEAQNNAFRSEIGYAQLFCNALPDLQYNIPVIWSKSFSVKIIFNFLFRNTIHGNNEFSAKICPCFEKS